MQTIDNRTVLLTQDELDATLDFEAYLDRGKNIPDAVALVQKDYPQLSRAFWAHLSK